MTRRDQLHAATKVEIKALARQHMAVQGNDALSLRAIARDLGMTAPALYRYFASRDDLLTDLVLDAFNAFADALEAADAAEIAQHGPTAYGSRLHAVMVAYRAWALAHPNDFALIYGTPIPGYHAPSETTAAASARSIAVVVRIIVEAHRTGKMTIPAKYLDIPASVIQQLVTLSETYQYNIESVPFYIGILGWTQIHGMVMLELFQHLGPVVQDTDAMYEFEIANFLRQFGLAP